MLFSGLQLPQRSRFPDSVLLSILKSLSLQRVLLLRETSTGIWSVVQRLFCMLFPARPLVLNHVLTRTIRWESPGPCWPSGTGGPAAPTGTEYRILDKIRRLYAGPSGSPIVVKIFARVTDGTFFPTSYQVEVISRFLRCGGDRVNVVLCTKKVLNCEYDLEDLCRLRDFIDSFSVQRGDLKIGHINVMRKMLPHDLKCLDLSGVSVPLASGAKTKTNRAKKDATEAMTKLLKGLTGLVNLSLRDTLLDVSLLPLGAMTSMQHLDLSNTRTDPKSVADAIKHMPGLRVLCLGHMHFDSDLANVAFSLLLERLDIPKCMITDASILSAAAGAGACGACDAKATQSLKRMDLSCNRLGSVPDLARLIKALPFLTKMDLTETFADHDELAPMLRGFPSVTFTLSFPTRGLLVDHNQRRFHETNLRYFPCDHGA
jgi:hypothetical protein